MYHYHPNEQQKKWAQEQLKIGEEVSGFNLSHYNCFQRRFDDPNQIRIQIEALACQEIFNRAETQTVQLIWPFVHEDETLLCPFPERQEFALELSTLCQIRIGPEDAIYSLA